MTDDIRTCIDRMAPPPGVDERMALVKGAKWQSNDSIIVSFMDGDPALHERVKRAAQVWTIYANLVIYFRQDPRADIRISFQRKGSWSHLGRFCRSVSADEPTMNFGWLHVGSSDDELSRVVLHEFGHALACIHEHNHPESGIQWKKQAVYDYYKGPPNNWSEDQIDRNLFKTYDKTLTLYSAPDPASIMMYPIDARFTEDGFSVDLNRELSDNDKSFIRKMYP